MPSPTIDSDQPKPLGALAGLRVLLLGKSGAGNRRDMQQAIRDHGGKCAAAFDDSVDLIVVGDDEAAGEMAATTPSLVTADMRQAANLGRLEIVAETSLWERLGLIDEQEHVRRLYTPAMLADLLKIPAATIRRWRQRGLLIPVKEVRKLPYFDFREVGVARRLAEMLTAGRSGASIEKQLAALSRRLPNVERPLAELSVVVEGGRLLIRRGEALLESNGQQRFDFHATDEDEETREAASRPIAIGDAQQQASIAKARLVGTAHDRPLSAEELLDAAALCEDEGEIEEAATIYRAALAAAGPRADVCFLLAEALYRLNDLSAARERYYAAIEIDENFVEARANLGCLLAELGQRELAAAAFEGALAMHDEYPDAHYHLARTLDDLGRRDEAMVHWRRFVALAPDSPWADEAVERLNE